VAGRKILIETPEPGVWVIRTATIIPDNERWLHEPSAKKNIGTALAWAANNPPQETTLSELKITKANGAKRKEHTA